MVHGRYHHGRICIHAGFDRLWAVPRFGNAIKRMQKGKRMIKTGGKYRLCTDRSWDMLDTIAHLPWVTSHYIGNVGHTQA